MNNKTQTKATNFHKSLVLALTVILIATLTMVVTLAAVSRKEKQSIGFKIAEGSHVQAIFESDVLDSSNENFLAFPGEKIKIKLGVKLKENSIDSYVRVKLSVETELQDDGLNLIKFSTQPSDTHWVQANFGTAENPNIWYLLVTKEVNESNTTRYSARALSKTDEQVMFIENSISLSEDIENNLGDKNISIVYKVESIQSENMPANPISQSTYTTDALGNRVYSNAKWS